MATAPKITRTVWAERQVEELLSLPLISEFVFRSPKHNDPTEKEVVDYLLVHKGKGILVSQKAQDDPTTRTGERNELWVRKNIQDALKPICGAIRQPSERPKWCDHPRRGRVEFATLPRIIQGIVLVETWRVADLHPVAADLPLEYLGVPISYFSINDFLNLIMQLRSVPELLEYLNARRCLPRSSLYFLGDEMPIFKLYLLNDGSLKGCAGRADARRAIETHDDLLQDALNRNAEYQFYSSAIEHVADCLAKRDGDYAEGLNTETLALFDQDGQRENYLTLQEILTDLRLRERAELGRSFNGVVDRVSRQGKGLSFAAAHLDGRDWVFLFISSRGTDKPDLFEIMRVLTGGALAHYQKGNCFVIIDRDGKHYDVARSHPDYQPTPVDVLAGQTYFGDLRMSTVDISRL